MDDVDDDDVHPSMRRVIVIMVTRSIGKSARAEVHEICWTDDARAAVRTCGPRGMCCEGFVPWTHDKSIASAPRGDMNSLDLTEFPRFRWLSYDFSKSARGRNLQIFCEKTFGC